MPTVRQRLFLFIEHPLFALPVGTLSGLVGIYVYSPLLFVCAGCILLALHRSRAISDWPRVPDQFGAYVLLGGIVTVLMFMLQARIQSQQTSQQLPTAKEIAGEVVKRLPPSTPTPSTPTPSTPTLPSTQPTKEDSSLSVTALATNISYPNEKFRYGMKWDPNFAEIVLSINNDSDLPITALDLTLEAGGEGIISVVGQMTRIEGVEFYAPESPSLKLQVRGADGEIGTIDMAERFRNADFNSGNAYRLFCRRLSAKTLLKINIASSVGGAKKVHAPAVLRIYGSYELTPSDGGKRVRVDQSVNVENAPNP